MSGEALDDHSSVRALGQEGATTMTEPLDTVRQQLDDAIFRHRTSHFLDQREPLAEIQRITKEYPSVVAMKDIQRTTGREHLC